MSILVTSYCPQNCHSRQTMWCHKLVKYQQRKYKIASKSTKSMQMYFLLKHKLSENIRQTQLLKECLIAQTAK